MANRADRRRDARRRNTPRRVRAAFPHHRVRRAVQLNQHLVRHRRRQRVVDRGRVAGAARYVGVVESLHDQRGWNQLCRNVGVPPVRGEGRRAQNRCRVTVGGVRPDTAAPADTPIKTRHRHHASASRAITARPSPAMLARTAPTCRQGVAVFRNPLIIRRFRPFAKRRLVGQRP
jgi:hypothetical protein